MELLEKGMSKQEIERFKKEFEELQRGFKGSKQRPKLISSKPKVVWIIVMIAIAQWYL